MFVAQIDKEWGFEGFFDGIYGDVIEEILKKYNMQRARDPNVAFRYLRDPTNHPIAVLVPDAGIIKGKHKKVMDEIRTYVHNGGIADFACSFSSFMGMDVMNGFWKSWGKDWVMSEYCRVEASVTRYASRYYHAMKTSLKSIATFTQSLQRCWRVHIAKRRSF